MFEARSILYLYVEHPLHAGSGRGLGAVDLPIQRERTTGYPMVQASGVKGCLRDETDPARDPKKRLTEDEWLTIFGPKTGEASEYAGSLSTGDARLLLFPVRSLAGVFAWTTSQEVLARFKREAANLGFSPSWDLPHAVPGAEQAYVNGDTLLAGGRVVLEEFSFAPDSSQASLVAKIGEWLAANALPASAEYQYYRQVLPFRLCILPDDDFRDFVLYATEVQTHIKIEPETKTVKSGALWTEESLPLDSLLYVPLLATPPRKPSAGLADARTILQKVVTLDLPRANLGGDETTGQGMVALRFGGVA
ncbi:MAG: type III-B CRISPR module RAMP protein Cmr4 [Chloroflexi bacterium RBG_16_58_14]|nr:MAG: type III-B CRISPR module RAMP protein Cmr4 [Chloroflexi bacterium RBG_16_58_14]